MYGHVRNDFSELLKKDEKELRELIDNLEIRIRHHIPGKLNTAKEHNKIRYYFIEDDPITGKRNRTYINSKQSELISQFAQQDYEIKLMKEAQFKLKKLCRVKKEIEDIFLPDIYSGFSEERKEFIQPLYPDKEAFINTWIEETFTPKAFSPSAPIFYTDRGERVRSKSEKIIADKYNAVNALYKYERPLKLIINGIPSIFHPDFTLLNTETCQELYHEHLGRMDDPEYVNDILWRIEQYAANGIFPGKNLFFTHETLKRPFNVKSLDSLIERYLNINCNYLG